MRLGATIACLAAAWLLLPLRVARGEAAPALPSQAELQAAAPLLSRGTVAIVHPAGTGRRARMLLLAKVAARASAVFDAIADPASYPAFMPAMQDVEVTGRRGHAVAYGWLWRVVAIPWRGSCAMALAPPSDIATRITESDLGTGELRWHMYDRGEAGAVVAESVAFDLGGGHPLVRWLLGRGAAMPEAVTLTVASVLLEGSRRGAARADGRDRTERRDEAGAELQPRELADLTPLLSRGSVVLLETTASGALKRAVVAEATQARPEVVLRAVRDPQGWTKAVPVVERLEVVGEHEDSLDLRLSLNLSVVRIGGTARLRRLRDGVEIVGTGGGLRSARLRLQVLAGRGGGTLLVSSGLVDLADASYFLRRAVEREPTFAHGINSAAQLLFVRGLLAEAGRE